MPHRAFQIALTAPARAPHHQPARSPCDGLPCEPPCVRCAEHFADKEQLFAEVVLATTDQVAGAVRMVAAVLQDSTDPERGLAEVARKLLLTLMQPDLLRLRRLVTATADQFPHVGTAWYDQGFGRALAALADRFQDLTDRGLLQAADPLLAAHHFVGRLLWLPVNRAMFTGSHDSNKADLESYADQAVSTFLRAYGGLMSRS